MKSALNLPHELITSIDVMNTLNGGTSEPVLRIKKSPAFHQITLRVPGIAIGNIKIEIKNDQLIIFYITTIVSQENEVQFPRFLYNKAIPYFIDVKHITASEEEDSLVVRLPFNDLANGYYRDISLKK